MHDAVADDSDRGAILADGYGVFRDQDGRVATLLRGDMLLGEGDDGVHAGEKLAVVVIDVHFGQQGTGVLVERPGVAGDGAAEGLLRERLEMKLGARAFLDVLRRSLPAAETRTRSTCVWATEKSAPPCAPAFCGVAEERPLPLVPEVFDWPA